MKLGGGVALPPRIPGKASSEAVTGGERADNGRGGGFGRVSRIVAEAMAEVDAKMLALPTPPSSPLIVASARRLPSAAASLPGLVRSGSFPSLGADQDDCGGGRTAHLPLWRRCSSLTDLGTVAAVSPAARSAASVESSPPSDVWEGEAVPPLRFCADLLPLPFA